MTAHRSNRAGALGAALALAAGLDAGGGAFSQALAQTLTTHRLPAKLAMEAANAAVSACAAKGYAVSATVMDADAVSIAVLRGDGAPVHTVEASWEKAYAATSFAPIFKLDSGTALAALLTRIGAAAPPGAPPFQTPDHMIARAGGLAIKLGGEVIGGIGVGGAPGAEADEACAAAGLAAIGDRVK